MSKITPRVHTLQTTYNQNYLLNKNNYAYFGVNRYI